MIAYVQTATQTSAAHRRLFQTPVEPCCWPWSAFLTAAGVSAFSSSMAMREFCEPSEPARERRRWWRRGEAGFSLGGKM